MRKTKLLLAACALFIGGVSSNAQSWVGNVPAEGTFLLYNVGADKFINNGDPKEDWGTNAYLQAKFGMDIKLEAAEGAYNLNTNVSNGGSNNYLGTSTWCDGGATPWTFTAVDGQANTYTIKNGDSYLVANDALDDIVYGASTDDNKSWWKLVSLDDFKTAMNAKVYSDSDPMDVSVFIQGRSFARNDNRNNKWTTSHDGGNWVWIGSAKKNTDNPHYFGNEAWNNTFDVYQEITGLPNGKYEVQCSGFGTNGTTYVYGNSTSGPLQSDNATERGNSKEAKWTAIAEDNAFAGQSSGKFDVTDGTIKLGVKRETNTNQDWSVFDEFRLFYYGPLADLTPFENALNEAIANAEAINQEAKMRASVLKDLQDAIKDYKDKTYSTEEEYTNATNAVKNATKNAKTSINSYKIIASGVIPDNSLDGWTCTNTNTFHINTWSGEGNSDGSNMTTPFIENWVGKGNFLGEGTVSYTLEGLEPGEAYYAQALVRSYNEANSDAPNGPNFFINDTEVSLPTAGTTFTYNNMSGIYATLGDVATVGEDGKLTLGVKIAADRNYNWVAFKNVSIQSMSDALAKAIANAEALEGKITAALYTTLSEFVSSHNTATKANIAAINEEVETYKAYVAPYSTWKTIKANAETLKNTPNDNATATSTLGTALSTQDGVAEGATDVATINQAVSDMKAAMATYCGVANPVGVGAKFDMTFMLTNPDVTDFPSWAPCAGWYTEQEGGNFQVMNNNDATSEDGTKTKFYEYYSNEPKSNNKFNLYQAVTLGEGTYTIKCYAFAAQPTGGDVKGVYFYANETPGSLVENAKLTEQSISFVNDKEKEVKIGLKSVTGNTYRWMGIGYMKLYKVQPKTFTIDEGADYDTAQEGAGAVTLKRTIKANTWNTLWLPFSMTESELKTTFGNDVEIAEYEEVANGENSTINFNVMATPAISPLTPVLLKTSTAGSSYTIQARTMVAGAPAINGTNFNFVGTAKATTDIADGNYFINANKLWESTGATTIKGTRAYIEANSDEARIVNFFIDGVETTGIEALEVINANNGKIYNLNGQKVNKAQKGLYIMNGKKMVVK